MEETSSVELFNLDLNVWTEGESVSKSFTGIGWVRNTITDNFFEQQVEHNSAETLVTLFIFIKTLHCFFFINY